SGEGELNRELVRALGAEVIVIGALKDTPSEEFEARMELTASRYGGFSSQRVIGSIINRVLSPGGEKRPSFYDELMREQKPVNRPDFNVLGYIPENAELMACRTVDIARHLPANVLHEGEI